MKQQKKSYLIIIAAFVLTAIILFGGLGVTVSAAQDALPGDALYPVKSLTEQVQRRLTGLSETASSTDDSEIIGILESISEDTWVIDGQTIMITDQTEIEGTPVIGDQVKVHVTVNDDGTFTASEAEVVTDDVSSNDNDNANDNEDDDNANNNNDDDEDANDNDDDVNDNDDDDNANTNDDDEDDDMNNSNDDDDDTNDNDDDMNDNDDDDDMNDNEDDDDDDSSSSRNRNNNNDDDDDDDGESDDRGNLIDNNRSFTRNANTAALPFLAIAMTALLKF